MITQPKSKEWMGMFAPVVFLLQREKNPWLLPVLILPWTKKQRKKTPSISPQNPSIKTTDPGNGDFSENHTANTFRRSCSVWFAADAASIERVINRYWSIPFLRGLLADYWIPVAEEYSVKRYQEMTFLSLCLWENLSFFLIIYVVGRQFSRMYVDMWR